ncbi:MAG: hypothetical protein WDW36_008353 [Sanguina aurantia]
MEEVMEADEREAAASVLHFFYTSQLTAQDGVSCSASSLLQMMKVADRWQAPQALASFSTVLCKLQPDDFPIAETFSLPAGLQVSPGFAAVKACARDSLMSLFGSAAAVATKPALLLRFLCLPLLAVFELLGSDALCTDAEATVLLLLSEWIVSENGMACCEEELQQLNGCIRYGRLSAPYLTELCSSLHTPPLTHPQQMELCTGTNAARPPAAITGTPSSTVSEPVPTQGIQQREQAQPGFNHTRPAPEPLGDAAQTGSVAGRGDTPRERDAPAAPVSPGEPPASTTPGLARTVPARSRKKAQGLLDAVDNLDQLADILNAATTSSTSGGSVPTTSSTHPTGSHIAPAALPNLSNTHTVAGTGGGSIGVDAAALRRAVRWELLSDPVVVARAAELLTHLLGNINLRVPPQHAKSFHKAVTQKAYLASSIIRTLAPALPACLPGMTTAQAASATQAVVKSHVQLQVLHNFLDLGGDARRGGSSPGTASARRDLKQGAASGGNGGSTGSASSSSSSSSGASPAKFVPFRKDHIAAAAVAAAAAAQTRELLRGCAGEMLSALAARHEVLLPHASLQDLERLAYSVTVHDWSSNPGPTRLLLGALAARTAEHLRARCTPPPAAGAAPPSRTSSRSGPDSGGGGGGERSQPAPSSGGGPTSQQQQQQQQLQGDLAVLTSLLSWVARSKWRGGGALCDAAAAWVMAAQVAGRLDMSMAQMSELAHVFGMMRSKQPVFFDHTACAVLPHITPHPDLSASPTLPASHPVPLQAGGQLHSHQESGIAAGSEPLVSAPVAGIDSDSNGSSTHRQAHSHSGSSSSSSSSKGSRNRFNSSSAGGSGGGSGGGGGSTTEVQLLGGACPGVSPATLSDLVWAFASTGHTHAPFMTQAASALLTMMPGERPAPASSSPVPAASPTPPPFTHSSPTAPATSHHGASTPDAPGAAQAPHTHGAQLDPEQLGRVAWAYSKLGFYHPTLMQRAAHALASFPEAALPAKTLLPAVHALASLNLPAACERQHARNSGGGGGCSGSNATVKGLYPAAAPRRSLLARSLLQPAAAPPTAAAPPAPPQATGAAEVPGDFALLGWLAHRVSQPGFFAGLMRPQLVQAAHSLAVLTPLPALQGRGTAPASRPAQGSLRAMASLAQEAEAGAAPREGSGRRGGAVSGVLSAAGVAALQLVLRQVAGRYDAGKWGVTAPGEARQLLQAHALLTLQLQAAASNRELAEQLREQQEQQRQQQQQQLRARSLFGGRTPASAREPVAGASSGSGRGSSGGAWVDSALPGAMLDMLTRPKRGDVSVPPMAGDAHGVADQLVGVLEEMMVGHQESRQRAQQLLDQKLQGLLQALVRPGQGGSVPSHTRAGGEPAPAGGAPTLLGGGIVRIDRGWEVLGRSGRSRSHPGSADAARHAQDAGADGGGGTQPASSSLLQLPSLVTFADGRAVGVQVEGPEMFAANRPWAVPTGEALLQDKLLVLSGHSRVAFVSAGEWEALGGEAERRRCVERKLRAALG